MASTALVLTPFPHPLLPPSRHQTSSSLSSNRRPSYTNHLTSGSSATPGVHPNSRTIGVGTLTQAVLGQLTLTSPSLAQLTPPIRTNSFTGRAGDPAHRMKRKSLESSFKLPSNHQSAGVAAAHTILPPPHRNSPHFRKNMSLIAIPHESPIMDLKGPLDHTQAALLVARNQRNVGRSERQSSCESSSLSTTCPHISAASIRNQLGLFDANDVGSGLDGDLDSIVPGTGLKQNTLKPVCFVLPSQISTQRLNSVPNWAFTRPTTQSRRVIC
jgi:hypothetical protein